MINLVKLVIAFAASAVLLFISLFTYGGITGYASQAPGQNFFSMAMPPKIGLGILAVDLIMVLVLRSAVPRIIRWLSAFLLVPFGAAVLSFLVVFGVYMLTAKFGLNLGL